MSEPDAVWGVVVAAGRGTRFGGGKQHRELAGRPLWEWASGALEEAGVAGIVLVGSVPGGIPGGERRRDSVAAGLARVPEAAAWVAIHDAARPLASAELIRRLVDRAQASQADGVVPGLTIADTVKRTDRTGRVLETVDRSDLVAVQTPQVFRVASLRAAHAHDATDATDDAVLVERWGGVVEVVEGEVSNFKITFPGDLDVAEAMLAARR